MSWNVYGHCNHYGSQPGGKLTCAKGIDLRAHVGGEDLGWARRLPCINPDSMRTLKPYDVVPCALREFPTPAEVEENRRQVDRDIDALLAGTCPKCGSSMTTRENADVALSVCPNGCSSVRGCKRPGEHLV